MGRYTSSREAFVHVAEKSRDGDSRGRASHVAEQQYEMSHTIHQLVDPKGYGVIRRSISWFEPRKGCFELLRGVAMLIESRLDTTGSMGSNVDVAIDVLPSIYDLLVTGNNAVLKRYDPQVIMSIFGDIQDQQKGKGPVLCRSQAEMDVRIAEQLRYMVPARDGGDTAEDPQYGLFGAAYLTAADINKYGLKSYDFTVTDAPGRHSVDAGWLKTIFGEDVFAKALENGHQINAQDVPETREVVASLVTRAHAFLIQVGDASETTHFWTPIFGPERIVKSTRTALLPQLQAAIIGLTEGTLDLQNLEQFLRGSGVGNTNNVSRVDAQLIKSSVRHIPIGAQTMLPNFSKLPLKGARFTNKSDLWPIGSSTPTATPVASKDVVPTGHPDEEDQWL